MKGTIVVGSILAVLFITLVPITNAVEIRTLGEPSSTLISYEQLKTMNAEEIVTVILSFASDYPEISEQFQHAVEGIELTPFDAQSQKTSLLEKNQGPQQPDDNQTVLEKIFWKIYNYRVFRLVVSALFFLKFQSKFTLWRTMTWGIRLLRWIKVGVLLGFIDPSQQQPPQTPTISFQQDLTNHTLTVTYTSTSDILWSDITEIGEGSCDSFPSGNVTIGDSITNCTGIIVLQYIPTFEILGVFEFE